MSVEPPIPLSVEGSRVVLERPLGRGGAGVVWEGSLEIGSGWRRVAVKKYDGGHSRRLADDEARIMRLLHGQDVPHIYGVDPEQGLLVMSFCDGVGLDRVLEECGRRGTKLPLRAAVGIGARIARALEGVHRTKTPSGDPLVHLDIKPPNVLLGRGSLWLIDFGIALFGAERSDGRGTPGYMAPEQRLRQPVGPAADVYSLGVLLAELVGAVVPGSGAPTVPEVPGCPELTHVIRQFTAPGPASRPAHGGRARRALEELFRDLGGTDDDLRLVYSLVTQELQTQALPPPEGADWAHFIAAFSAGPRGPTKVRPPTEVQSQVPRPTTARTQESPLSDAGSDSDPPAAAAPPPQAATESRQGRPRRTTYWLVPTLFVAGALAVAGYSDLLPDSVLGVRLGSPERVQTSMGTTTGKESPDSSASSGTLRLRSRRTFDVLLEGRMLSSAATDHRVTLPVGSHRVVARCQNCPAGSNSTIEARVSIAAGQETLKRIRFE